MRRFNEKRSNSELYRRIKALPMTEGERRVALSALQDGTVIADAVLSVINGFKHLFADAALKPGLKH